MSILQLCKSITHTNMNTCKIHIQYLQLYCNFKEPPTSKDQITTIPKPCVHVRYLCTHVPMNTHLYKYMYMYILIVVQFTNYKFVTLCGFNSIPIENVNLAICELVVHVEKIQGLGQNVFYLSLLVNIILDMFVGNNQTFSLQGISISSKN